MRETPRSDGCLSLAGSRKARSRPLAARLRRFAPVAAGTGAIVLSLVLACSRGPLPGMHQVEFQAADGFRLQGTVWTPGGRGEHPAVLMFANLTQDRAVYKKLGEQLADTGLVALSVDLRVQGGSAQATDNADPFSPENLRNLGQDARAALAYLKERKDVDPRRIALVAADGVVELVQRTIWSDSSIVAAALLSPILPDSLAPVVATHPPRPLFLACSFGDPSAAQVTKAIGDASPNARSYTKFYFACGHGTDMLWSPEGDNLTRLLRDWLVDALRE